MTPLIQPISAIPMEQPSSTSFVPPAGAPGIGLLDMPASERIKLMRIKRRLLVKSANQDIRPEHPSTDPVPSTEPTPSEPTPSKPTQTQKRRSSKDSTAELPHKRSRIEASDENLQQPTSSRPSIPTSHQATPSAATLWPNNFDEFPFDIFEHFICPRDDARYEGYGFDELIYSFAVHQSRATALTGRLLRHCRQGAAREEVLEAEVGRLTLEAQITSTSLEDEKRLRSEAELKCNGLRAELDAAQKRASEAEEQRDALRRDHEGLKGVCAELRQDLMNVERKLEAVETKFEMSEGELKIVKMNFAELKAMGSPLTEEVRQQICQDYRRSAELNGEIIQQFTDGYQEARDKDKERLLVAKLDPSILDSSDEEADA